MPLKGLLPTVLLMLLSGCTCTLHLFPVHGPLSLQRPVPIIEAVCTMPGDDGTVEIALPDGEKCTGSFKRFVATVPPPDTPMGEAPLPQAWDQVYGGGTYLATVVGRNDCIQASLQGKSGLTIKMIFLRFGLQGLKGAAIDNRGNLYKVIKPYAPYFPSAPAASPE